MKPVAERLADFGARMLLEHWRTGEVDDVLIQQAATDAGLLEWIVAAAPCGPACGCARLSTFPQQCLTHPDDVRAVLTALDANGVR